MYSLFLYDTTHHLDIYTEDQLQSHLQNNKFIKEHNGILIPDDQFMFLITFLGCSPNINLETKIEIQIHVNKKISAFGGESIVKLVCPNCKTKISQANQLISSFKDHYLWNSDCCDKDIDIQKINWRKSAGFSQSFIQINNIFPKEAIPSEGLQNLLNKFSQSSWNYFYSKQQNF